MVSRDAHLGNNPTKKCKKKPTRLVRKGVATTGREGAGPGAGHILFRDWGGGWLHVHLLKTALCGFSEPVLLPNRKIL